jgi:hypothetical protein
MKKTFLPVFGLLISFISIGFVSAQTGFESTYNSNFTVRNVSQNNIDASSKSVNPGDILMYQIQLTGTAPVTNEVIRVRTGALDGTMTLVDSTDGRAEGSYIYFPTVSDAKSSWTRTFAFYMRIEREPVKSSVTMSFGAKNTTINIDGSSVSVTPSTPNTKNNPVAVPRTGANYNLLLVVGAIITLMLIGRVRRRI